MVTVLVMLAALATCPTLQLYEEARAYQWAEATTGRHDMKSVPLREKAVPDGLLNATSLLVGPLDNGLLANVLQVLDAAMFASREGGVGLSNLVVMWTRISTQRQFTYGQDSDVWPALFEPIDPEQKNDFLSTAMRADKAFQVRSKVNPLLLAPSRALYLAAPFWAVHRAAYSAIAERVLKPMLHVHSALSVLVGPVGPFHAAREAGGRVVGLHCRADHPAVRTSFGAFSPCNSTASKAAVAAALGAKDVLYLATDSTAEAEACREAYGLRCVLNEGIAALKGATRGTGEIHKVTAGESAGKGLSLDDAADALIDTWALSRTDVLLHNSESNIVLVAAILSPSLPLVPLYGAKVLEEGGALDGEKQKQAAAADKAEL